MAYLTHFLPAAVLKVIPDQELREMAKVLQGRARLAAEFVRRIITAGCQDHASVRQVYLSTTQAMMFGRGGPQDLSAQSVVRASSLSTPLGQQNFLSMWRITLQRLGQAHKLDVFTKQLALFLENDTQKGTVFINTSGDPEWDVSIDLVDLGLAMFVGDDGDMNGRMAIRYSVREPMVLRTALTAAAEAGMSTYQAIITAMNNPHATADLIGNLVEQLVLRQMQSEPFPMRLLQNLVVKCAERHGLALTNLPSWFNEQASSAWRLTTLQHLYNVPARDLPFQQGLRSDVIIKPDVYAGADAIVNGAIFCCKTSPFFLTVNDKRESQSNLAKGNVSHLLEQAGMSPIMNWPVISRQPAQPSGQSEQRPFTHSQSQPAATHELLGCILIDLQLPFKHAKYERPACEVISTTYRDSRSGDSFIRHDVSVLVDFSTLDLLLGPECAMMVQRCFAKKVEQHQRQLPGTETVATAEAVLAYWKDKVA